MSKPNFVVCCFLVLMALACTSSQTLQPISPFQETRAFVPSQSPTVFQTVDPSIDLFLLTATSIVATATAQVGGQSNNCRNLQVITRFHYSDINHFEEPSVYDSDWGAYPCNGNWNPSYRYEIEIFSDGYPVPEWRLIQILEDAVSRLPDYPPFDGNTSAQVQVIFYLMRGTMWYTSFSYSEGIAAYESGLRGAELARTLGIDGVDLTATVILQDMTSSAAAEQTTYAMQLTETVVSNLATATASSPLSFAETREAIIATATAQDFPTIISQLSAFQTLAATLEATDTFVLTAISLIETATATAGGISENCHREIFVSTAISYIFDGTSTNFRDPLVTSAANETPICGASLPPNYAIIIEQVDVQANPDDIVFLVLEDAVSRLPDYPPLDESNQNIEIRVCFTTGQCISYNGFSYSDALAAYESGLRGADLAEALGVRMP
jgi:hypothetical protein